ncbi:MAG TPA: hypothetical protein VIF62_03265, partial [Labilithrix sp.]
MKRCLSSFASLVIASVLACACTTSTEDPQDPASGSGDVVASGTVPGADGGTVTPTPPAPPPPPAPRSDDGIKNGTETDVDCGGDAAPACAPGKGCVAASDCDSSVCGADRLCAAPSPTDGVKNGDETDIDCGGASAPKCAVDKKCSAHADCASDACGYKGTCVAIRSCTAHHGGDTCGAGEDCCTTIDMPAAPGGDVKLDKYTITAGRFRQFVERTNGDLRGYMAANAPAWWNASWNAFLPNVLDS